MGGRGLSPAPDHDTGPEAEEMPYSDKGGGNGAVRVLKRKDQRRRRSGLEQAWGLNPRRQLGHLEGAQRRVILQEVLEANRGGMSGWGVICDTCGNSIDENLAPADIKAGGDARTRIRQRGGNGRGEEVGGGRELVS